MATEQSKQTEKTGKKGLKRHLGVFSVFSICTGAAFSSGFFLLPGMAAETTGPSLPLAYLAAGLLMLPAILSISELSAAMPRSGGPYFFVTRSFGSLLGMIGAFGKFIQLLLKGAFAFVGVGIYLSLLLDVPIQGLAVGLIVLFTIINLLGVRQTAQTEKILVVILLIILTYFLVAGATQLFSISTDLQAEFQPFFPSGWAGFVSAIALVFISFGGVAQVASVAEEVRDPAHSFPKGILLSLAVSTFFYLAGTMLMIILIAPEILSGDERPAATAAQHLASLPLPASIMVIAALAAFASTGNAAILSASRYPYALAKDRLLWKKFGMVNKNGTPQNAVILSGVLSILLVLLFNVKEIAKIASAFLLFVFLTMCLAVIIFRESKKDEYQPGFKSPYYPWLQIIGCVAYTWLIWESGMGAMAFITGVFALGILWYVFGIKEKPQLSAAIYYLFRELAQKGIKTPYRRGVNLSLSGSELASAVEHAIFIDLDEEKNFDDVIEDAAEALRNRLGGRQEEISEVLKEEIKHWKNPLKFNISAAPALLKGIEQPEMIIIRGKIKIEERNIKGLVVLVDDENSPNRLLKLIAQLEIAINHRDFPQAWKKAENAAEIKKALIQDVRSLSIAVKEKGPGRMLIGKKVKDVELPEHSLIGGIYRQGSLSVPTPETKIKKDDEIIFLVQGKAFQKLSDQFSEAVIEI